MIKNVIFNKTKYASVRFFIYMSSMLPGGSKAQSYAYQLHGRRRKYMYHPCSYHSSDQHYQHGRWPGCYTARRAIGSYPVRTPLQHSVALLSFSSTSFFFLVIPFPPRTLHRRHLRFGTRAETHTTDVPYSPPDCKPKDRPCSLDLGRGSREDSSTYSPAPTFACNLSGTWTWRKRDDEVKALTLSRVSSGRVFNNLSSPIPILVLLFPDAQIEAVSPSTWPETVTPGKHAGVGDTAIDSPDVWAVAVTRLSRGQGGISRGKHAS